MSSYQVSVGRRPLSSAGSLSGAPGEARISSSRLGSLRSLPIMDPVGLSSLRAGLDSLLSQGNHQEALQGLNGRLAGYLDRVRGLEAENRRLEDEIAEVKARRVTVDRDWEAYESPLVDLRKQVEGLNMDNAKLLLQIDNARLAADDFKVKLETEQAICDGVQKDTQGLRKMIDDTNFLRMKLEAELEALKEELAHLRKSHNEDVEALKALIAKSSVTVEVDAPKNTDLNVAIAQVRSQYENMANQNRAEAENIYKDKIDNMSQEVTQNTQALEQAKSEVTELRRQLQGLQLDRQTLQKTVDSLEHNLRDTEDHYGRNLSDLNQILHRLQAELATCRADIERQVREYEALLNLKTKLENEINNYRRLLEGAIDREESKAVIQTAPQNRRTIKKVVVTTQEIVNGKVVSSKSEAVIH